MPALSPKPEALSSAGQNPARPWLAIVGIGEDGRAGLPPAAQAALDGAEFVVGGARHLRLAQPLAAETLAWPSPLADAYPKILARRGRPTCVLATGDPFFHGVGAELARLVAPEEMACFPQASAFSLAAARLGWSLPECACVSLHGRALERIIPHLQPGARVLALSWDGSTPARLAALLAERGFGGSVLTVLEALGGPRERVWRAAAGAFDLTGVNPLNTVAVEVVARVTPASSPSPPASTTAGSRTTANSRKPKSAPSPCRRSLRARASCSGTWAREPARSASNGVCATRNEALAIEERPDRAERIRRNARALGATEVEIVVGRAPEALAGLAPPDAVFIGGGLTDAGVFEAAWARSNPAGGSSPTRSRSRPRRGSPPCSLAMADACGASRCPAPSRSAGCTAGGPRCR